MAIDVDKLYRTYAPMVLRRCRQMLRDEDAAADALQDTFVRAIRYRDRLSGRAPSSLLYTIATNVCLNRIRSNGQRGTVAAGDAIAWIATADDGTDRAMTLHFLDRLFAEHPADTRTMAMLHYVDGLTLEETARACGFSVSGVRKRLRTLRGTGIERWSA